MTSRHILALVTAVCVFAGIGTGALLTSANALPGLDLSFWSDLHRGVAAAAAAGAAALAYLLSGPIRVWLLASIALAAAAGGLLETGAAAQMAGLVHAVSGSLLASACAVAIIQLRWRGAPETFADEGSPSLQSLAKATWIALLIQTALGALYRHRILGLVPHVSGAMLVMGMVMYAGIAAVSTEDAPPAVKRPALSLLIMTGVQMLLGLAAYLYRLEFREHATGQDAMLTFTVMHVAVGALTTACSALLGMQISRYVRPRPALVAP